MLKNKKGITLIALIITMIVLLILAGVSINLTFGENGIISKAKNAVDKYKQAAYNEQILMNGMFNYIGEESSVSLSNGSENKEGSNEEDKNGAVSLSATDISKIKAKLKLAVPQEVNYTPKPTENTVTIPSANNDGVTTQEFNQSNLNALGTNAVKWYLLNVNENGVTLVSQPTSTSKTIAFKGWGGYTNCLYYLDQITSTLFSNSEKGSVAHCLRLTDIKEAAKLVNNWSNSDWETNFVNKAVFTTLSNGTSVTDGKYYPNLYGTRTGSVIINNLMYDETPAETGIPMSTAVGVNANSLTLNGTYFDYLDENADDDGISNQLTNLSTFGGTGIAKELFNSNNEIIWIASRSIHIINSTPGYALGIIGYGTFGGLAFALGLGTVSQDQCALRAVVEIPADHVAVSDDGSVSII